jgi:hypothetical protein
LGHKNLKDHAHVFCQMFFGWRMSEDLETFAQLPEGKLTIDVLTGSCVHDAHGPVQTYIAGEIGAWFRSQLTGRGISIADITEATLSVDLKRRPTPKGKRGITFDWYANSTIRTADRDYTADLAEPHTWIPRS